MTFAAGPALSRRERITLAAFVGFPFAVYVLLVALGYVSYLKLAAFGVVAMVTAVALFLRPRAALWVLLAYIYVGPETPLAGAAGPMAFLILAAVLFGMLRGEPNRVVDPLFWYANGFLLLLDSEADRGDCALVLVGVDLTVIV